MCPMNNYNKPSRAAPNQQAYPTHVLVSCCFFLSRWFSSVFSSSYTGLGPRNASQNPAFEPYRPFCSSSPNLPTPGPQVFHVTTSAATAGRHTALHIAAGLGHIGDVSREVRLPGGVVEALLAAKVGHRALCPTRNTAEVVASKFPAFFLVCVCGGCG